MKVSHGQTPVQTIEKGISQAKSGWSAIDVLGVRITTWQHSSTEGAEAIPEDTVQMVLIIDRYMEIDFLHVKSKAARQI